MKGYENGFQAISKYLHESVEDKYLGDEFQFGESRIGGYDYTSRCRYLEAVLKFWATLDEGQKHDLVCDVLDELDTDEFLSAPFKSVTGYLLSNANWCYQVTAEYHDYASSCRDGNVTDRKVDEAMDKVFYL